MALAASVLVSKRWGWLGGVFVAIAVARCGFDGALCGSGAQSPCTSQPVAGTHAIDVRSGFCGGCVIQCETGWLDCDNNVDNGCETPGTKCADPFSDAGKTQPTVTLLATLSGTPHGIAICGTNVFYFDDADLYQVVPNANPKKRATSPSTPTGGIACDGTFVYWATNGTIWELPVWATSATALATGVDPGAGVDLRGSSVYFIQQTADAGSMLARTTGDAGWTAIMPASQAGVYKPFALTSDGDYSIDQGTIWFNALAQDSGGPVQIASGASALALVAGSSAAPFVVSASTGSDLLTPLFGDAGTPIPVIVAATAAKTKAVLASDDAVYAFDLQKNVLETLAPSALHVTDVAMDDSNAYWTTRGEGVTLGAVWAMTLP